MKQDIPVVVIAAADASPESKQSADIVLKSGQRLNEVTRYLFDPVTIQLTEGNYF